MNRYFLALAIGTAALVNSATAESRPAARSAAEDARFQSFSDRFVDELLKLQPVYATQVGDHRFDDALPDVSPAGRARMRAFVERSMREIKRFDRARLSRENQVDAILLQDQLEYQLWSDRTLQDWAWDPQTYAGTLGGGLFGLVGAREFAPLPVRLRAVSGRLEALPRFLEQAKSALAPARVPRIHAETVAKQNPGIAGLIDGILAQKNALSGVERTRLEAAAAAAKTAVASYQTWLDKELVPNAKGNERIGAKLYAEKFHFTTETRLTPQDIHARAERDIRDMRGKMYRIAAGMLKGRAGAPPTPANPTAGQEQAVIEAGLANGNADMPPRDQVLPFARKALDEATAFAKSKDLVSFPAANFRVIEMPEYARGTSVAYADMPGAFEKDQSGYFAVMPIPSDWTEQQTSSFLREYNRWAIHELTLHEGVPGHLLQLSHANQFKSRLRALLQSGPMVEGWACYGQDVMADAGYLAGEPRYLLAHYKFQLRGPVNAILDQDFHAGTMTREQAMELMTKTAFQEEREAAGKWVRLQLSSAQLPTYFVGYQEWKDLRAAAEKRPGFNLKRFHDEALSHGSPPVRFIRQLTLGEPIH